MFRRVILINSDFGKRAHSGRVEQAEFETSRQRVSKSFINFIFTNQSFLDRSYQSCVISAATKIATGFDCVGGSFFRRGHVVMLLRAPDIMDCATVRNNVTVKSPLLTQNVCE